MGYGPKLKLTGPCTLRWEDLNGSNVARFCELCCKTVHNLDALSGIEIQSLLADSPSGFCGTYVGLDKEFTVPLPEPVPKTMASKRVGVAAIMFATAFVGCSDPSEQTPTSGSAEQISVESAPESSAQGQTNSEEPPSDELTEQQMEALRSLGYFAPES